MSSLVIVAAAVLRYHADKQTDRQTNPGENPTPMTVVGISSCHNIKYILQSQVKAKWQVINISYCMSVCNV